MRRRAYQVSLVVYLFLLTAVAYGQTALTDIWKDKEHSGTAQKVSVFWITAVKQNRLIAENDFVRQLKQRGLAATPAYVVIPPDKHPGKEEVLEKFRGLGVDIVVTLRAINRQAVLTPMPTTGPASPANLTGFYQFVYDAPVQEEPGSVYLETNVFDMKAGKRVWAARTMTAVDVVDQKALSAFVGTMIDRLAADRIIP